MLTLAFEAHFMALSGYPPRVDSCVLCGKPIAGEARFDARLGGAVCLACPSYAPRISLGARRILYKLPRTRFENAPKLVREPGLARGRAPVSPIHAAAHANSRKIFAAPCFGAGGGGYINSVRSKYKSRRKIRRHFP